SGSFPPRRTPTGTPQLGGNAHPASYWYKDGTSSRHSWYADVPQKVTLKYPRFPIRDSTLLILIFPSKKPDTSTSDCWGAYHAKSPSAGGQPTSTYAGAGAGNDRRPTRHRDHGRGRGRFRNHPNRNRVQT